MSLKPLLLWTDVLLGLLILGGLILAGFIRRRRHLRAPWQRVMQSKSGMISLVILSFFLAIGLLDSIHFRPLVDSGKSGTKAYSVEVLSLLDLMVAPLRQRPEKTYSAPLATHLYAKETLELADGRQVRTFPRLVYGGAHLSNPEEMKAGDITKRVLAGIGLAIFIWALAAGAWLWYLSRRHRVNFRNWVGMVFRGRTPVPWHGALFTVLALLLVGGPAALLSIKYHLLGTDKVGQDVLYLALKSIRTGLVIGMLTTLVLLPLAVLLGIMAGYFRGWMDDLIQYIYTTFHSIPSVLLIAAAILMTQVYMDTHPNLFETVNARADFRLLFLCLILGMTSWTGLCRLLRGEALKLREMEYIQAAQAFGVSDFRIIIRHILPNVLHIVLISMVMDFSGLVLAEAVLSYVGVGVDPSMISFGTMINSARLEMAREPMVWWSLAAAFSFMFLMVLSANLFADAVRDAFDPRVQTLSGKWGLFGRNPKNEAVEEQK